jgi:hypothetical protein
MKYEFLILTLIFWVPGILIYILRFDLRRVIHLMAAFSLPFAATEWLFYPDYWEPAFLFNLIDVLGFGIEDILFVTGLSAFTSTVYAFCSGKTLEIKTVRWGLVTLIFTATGTLVTILTLGGVATIYASMLITAGISAWILWLRRDLIQAGLIGSLLTTAIYFSLCIIFGMTFPQVFEITWHTTDFLNLFVMGVPIEELLYGAACGLAATVFLPYVTEARFVSRDTTLAM